MSSTNKRMNETAIKKYRKELAAMLGDIAEIDKKVLNKAVLAGDRKVKEETPVDTGHLQRNWHFTRARTVGRGVESTIYNNVEYAPYVNYGHRVGGHGGSRTRRKQEAKSDGNRPRTASKGKAVNGFVKGAYMLEKAMNVVDRTLVREFGKEVERVNRAHDK